MADQNKDQSESADKFSLHGSKMVISQQPFIAVPFVDKRKKRPVSPMTRRGAGQAGVRVTPNLSPVASSLNSGTLDKIERLSEQSSKQPNKTTTTTAARGRKSPSPPPAAEKQPEKKEKTPLQKINRKCKIMLCYKWWIFTAKCYWTVITQKNPFTSSHQRKCCFFDCINDLVCIVFSLPSSIACPLFNSGAANVCSTW